MKIALIPNSEKSDAVAAANSLAELLRSKGDVSLLMNPPATICWHSIRR